MMGELKIINFPKILDDRGNLTFLQYQDSIPFKIQRVFWTYDVPGGMCRGSHAYKKQHEVIIALSGSFDVVITDVEHNERRFSLNRSYFGLYLPPLTFRRIENFSTNSLSLHISSEKFSEADYLRNLSDLNHEK